MCRLERFVENHDAVKCLVAIIRTQMTAATCYSLLQYCSTSVTTTMLLTFILILFVTFCDFDTVACFVCLSVWLCVCLLVSVATTGTCASDEKVVFQVVLVFHHHLTLVIPCLKPSFSANPSHRSLPFVLQD